MEFVWIVYGICNRGFMCGVRVVLIMWWDVYWMCEFRYFWIDCFWWVYGVYLCYLCWKNYWIDWGGNVGKWEDLYCGLCLENDEVRY